MDEPDIARRLETQNRLLHEIVAALVPPDEEEASGFDDLVEVLTDLTVAVSDVTLAVRALRSSACERCRQPADTPCVEG